MYSRAYHFKLHIKAKLTNFYCARSNLNSRKKGACLTQKVILKSLEVRNGSASQKRRETLQISFKLNSKQTRATKAINTTDFGVTSVYLNMYQRGNQQLCFCQIIIHNFILDLFPRTFCKMTIPLNYALSLWVPHMQGYIYFPSSASIY